MTAPRALVWIVYCSESGEKMIPQAKIRLHLFLAGLWSPVASSKNDLCTIYLFTCNDPSKHEKLNSLFCKWLAVTGSVLLMPLAR